MSVRTLPLGVDIGTTRLRIALAHVTARGPCVTAIATRDIPPNAATSGEVRDPDFVSVLVEDALAELQTKERRAVCAIAAPDASLWHVTFPRMGSLERERAARFEAQRYVEYPIEEAVVRVHALDTARSLWSLGVARARSVQTRVNALRRGGLKPLAMDHESLVLTRALPNYDAIVDIGHARCALHVRAAGTPRTFLIPSGGADITSAIQYELTIDADSAESRKRILGTSGAGERAQGEMVAAIADQLRKSDAAGNIKRAALVGNSARLPSLAADLEEASGVFFDLPVAQALRSGAYPPDVIRAGAPDWTTAAGLALWSTTDAL